MAGRLWTAALLSTASLAVAVFPDRIVGDDPTGRQLVVLVTVAGVATGAGILAAILAARVTRQTASGPFPPRAPLLVLVLGVAAAMFSGLLFVLGIARLGSLYG